MRRVASRVVLALAVLSCSNTAVQHAERLVSNGDLEGARAALEAEHQREPEDVDVRVALVIRDVIRDVVKRSVLRPVRAKMSEEFG